MSMIRPNQVIEECVLQEVASVSNEKLASPSEIQLLYSHNRHPDIQNSECQDT